MSTGHFTDKITDFAGMYVKDADKHIIKHLKGTGRMIVDTQLRHSYPMCYRSGYALDLQGRPVLVHSHPRDHPTDAEQH